MFRIKILLTALHYQALAANGIATSEKAGNGTYKLGIFGPNAEEIAGSVLQDNNALVGFGGKKQ